VNFIANKPPAVRAKVDGKSKDYIALTTRTEAAVKGVTNETFDAMRDGVKLDPLSTAIEKGDHKAAYVATDVETTSLGFEAMTPELEKAMVASADIALTEVEVAGGFVFNPAAPGIRQTIEKTVGRRIVEISEQSRMAVNNIISDAITTGRHPRNAAKQIKEIVGLNGRQQKAVDTFRRNLEVDGLTGAKLDKRVARYAKKQHKLRSEMIARTESSEALNGGRQELWTQLQDAGALPKDQKVRWITANDERVCPICGPLDQNVVELHKNFSVALDQPRKKTTITYAAPRPPIHPACRCSLILVEA